MATQSEICVIGATQLIVGTSSIAKFVPGPYSFAQSIKYGSGGSLEIVGVPVALTGSSAASWGKGYLIGTTEVVSWGGPAVFYLAATGATTTVQAIFGQTAGASFL